MTDDLSILRCPSLLLSWGWTFCLLAAPLGCTPPAPHTQAAVETPASVSDADLRQELDEVLDFTLQQRQLNSVDHGAWQILHGVLAYQQVFPIRVGKNGPSRPALDYLLDGGQIRGWTFEPGEILDAATGHRGVRAIVEPGTRKGQGHADQWLAILAQCNLPRDRSIKLAGQSYSIDDYVRQVQRDLPYNAQSEWSWTLIGLTHYLPTDATWEARDGEQWSIERLVEAEIEQNIDDSACGGTHRLIGLATALKRRRAEGGQIDGVWARADQIVQNAIRRALELQNPDGSFSSQYFRRPGSSPDMAIVLGASGHVLEFLTVAMTDSQLRDPQVRLAARQLCGLFRDTQQLPLECGALYHATHGLVLFRERTFGPREYHSEASAGGDAAAASGAAAASSPTASSWGVPAGAGALTAAPPG